MLELTARFPSHIAALSLNDISTLEGAGHSPYEHARDRAFRLMFFVCLFL